MQGIIITGLVGFGVIKSIDGVPKNSTSNGLQEFLICVEMFIAAIAFTYNFSHRYQCSYYFYDFDHLLLYSNTLCLVGFDML